MTGPRDQARSLLKGHGADSATAPARPVPAIRRRFVSLSDHPEVTGARQRDQVLRAGLDQLGAPGLYNVPHQGVNGAVIRAYDRDLINFCGYNYLGLAGDPRVQAAARQAIDTYGTSCSASRLISGEIPLHAELEARLADAYQAGGAVVGGSGFLTGAAVIAFVLGARDVAVCDSLVHNSLVSGTRWAGCQRVNFRHNDPESLDSVLRRTRGHFERAMVILEGVYSMDGDIARLPELAEVARRHDCLIMIDEAHSFGVLGKTGCGIREHLGLPGDAADIWMGTVELRGLRDPARLRAWLYAVARNECLRRLRAGILTATLDEAADVPADIATADPVVRAERADLRALVRSAIDGLNPRDRDIVELSLVHELEGNDLVAALGVPRNHAHALLSRARSQLEKSLGALIVARGGRRSCPELDVMLDGWDGQLNVLMRKRINRHVERCETCGECRRRELSPALLAGLAPLPFVLPGFRDQVLRMMADHSSAGLTHRLVAAKHAGPFGPSGFPPAMSVPGPPWRPAVRHAHALAGAVTSAMAIGVIVVVGIGGPHTGMPPGVAGSTHGAAVSPGRSAEPGSGGTSPMPSMRAAAYPAQAASGPPSAVRPADVPSSSGRPEELLVRGQVSPSAATPAPSQGTLTVSPATLDLVALNGTPIGTLTLTAEGGPVDDYSVSVGSALAGDVTVSPSSGSLAAGASVTVTVTVTSLLVVNAQITVNPGDQKVLVLLGV